MVSSISQCSPRFGGNDSIRPNLCRKKHGWVSTTNCTSYSNRNWGGRWLGSAEVTKMISQLSPPRARAPRLVGKLEIAWSHFWMFSILGEWWTNALFGGLCNYIYIDIYIYICRWLKQAVAILQNVCSSIIWNWKFCRHWIFTALTQLYIQHRHQVLLYLHFRSWSVKWCCPRRQVLDCKWQAGRRMRYCWWYACFGYRSGPVVHGDVYMLHHNHP